jgi:hypothetical protein
MAEQPLPRIYSPGEIAASWRHEGKEPKRIARDPRINAGMAKLLRQGRAWTVARLCSTGSATAN